MPRAGGAHDPRFNRSGKRRVMPSFQMVVEMPAPFLNTVNTIKLHNQSVNKAIEDTLRAYWKGAWRDHFKSTARGQFGYRDRASVYKAIKRKETGSITDIVHSGRTKTSMTHTVPKFSIAKGAVGGISRQGTTTGSRFGTTGVLTLKFGFPATTKDLGLRKDGQRKISPTEMAEELGRWTDEGMYWASKQFMERYKDLIRAALIAAPKWKKKYARDFNNFHNATS